MDIRNPLAIAWWALTVLLLSLFRLPAAFGETQTEARAKAAGHRAVAHLYGYHGKWVEAKQELAKAIALDRDDYRNQCCRAWIALSQNDCHTAASIYQQVTSAHPDSADAWLGLASVRFALGRAKGAGEAATKALRLKPDSSKGHCCLGWLAADRSDYGKAETEFHKAAELRSTAGMARLGLARVYGNLGDPAKAWGTFDEVGRGDCPSGRISCCTAWLYSKQGDWTSAVSEYQVAISAAPGLVRAHLGLAWAYGKLGRTKEALQTAKQARILAPQLAKAVCCEGWVYSRMEQWKEAEKRYRQALKTGFDRASLHLNLGWALHGEGRFSEMLAETKAAARLEPRNAKVHCCFGLTYGHLARWKESVKEFETAAQMQPDLPELQGMLIWARGGLAADK